MLRKKDIKILKESIIHVFRLFFISVFSKGSLVPLQDFGKKRGSVDFGIRGSRVGDRYLHNSYEVDQKYKLVHVLRTPVHQKQMT